MSESRFDRTADRYVEAAQKKDWTAFIELCRPQPDDRALDVAAGHLCPARIRRAKCPS